MRSIRFAKSFLVVLILAAAAVSCNRSPQEKAARFMASGKNLLEKGEYTSAFLQFKNAARLIPHNAEPFYYMGLVSISQGNAKEAIQCLVRATQADPKYAAAQIKLAEVMVLSRRADLLKQAGTRAKTVLSDHPDDVDALAVLASIEKESGDLNGAEKDLREALDRNPQSLKSSAGLASVELSRGNWSAAEAILKQARVAAPHSPDPLVALGELYLFKQRDAEAAAQFRRALQLNPGDAPALLHLAQIAASAGRRQEAEDIYRQLAAKQPGKFGELFAAFLSQSGKLNAAISEYRTVLNADPDNRRARSSLVIALLRAGRPNQAQAVLNAALQKNPGDIDALQQNAQMLLEAGKYEESRQALTQVLEREPNSAEAHYLLSGVYKAQKQFVRQYQELNEALRLKPQLLSARIELARALLRDNKAPEALDVLNRAPAAQQSTMLTAQRNWTFLALHDLERFGRGIPAGAAGATPEFVLQRGILELANKNFAGAEASFENALQQSPADIRALEALVETYEREKHPDLALQKLRFYAARQPQSAALQLFAGNWFLRNGRLDEARAEFSSVLAADPGNSDADLALVQLDEQRGNSAAARARLEKLLARDDHNAAAQVLLGELEQSSGNRDAAIQHYRKAIEISPSDPATLNNLAWALSDSPGEAEQALAYAQKAKELAPDDPAIDDTLGWLLCKQGIYHQALEYVQTAAAETHNAIPQYHLAIIYFDLGNIPLGKKALAAATRLDPTLAEASLAKKALAQATGQRQN